MSRVQTAVLCDKATSSSTPFAFGKILKKTHGAMDESLSEQQFRKLDTIPLLCEKSGAILVLMGLTADSPAGRLAVVWRSRPFMRRPPENERVW